VSILMLSDGKQTRGLLEPLEGAARARELHIPVFSILLGPPPGGVESSWGGIQRTIPVPPDPQTLSAIARTTGGRFFAARSAESLRSAYEKLGSSLGREPGKTEITYVFLPVAAGLLLAAGPPLAPRE